MKNNSGVELALGPEAPPGLIKSLRRVAGVRVRTVARKPHLRHAGGRWPVRVFARPILIKDAESAAATVLREAHEDGAEVIPLVYSNALPRTLRDAFEVHGVSYADMDRVHLVAPGVLLHLDARPPRPAATARHSGGIGIVGIRAVQALATQPRDWWTVSDLATVAGVSLGEAHKVFGALEAQELIEARGSGPRKRRRVRDLGALLDWLAEQPRARRVYDQLLCSCYARTPADLARKVTAALEAAEIVHAFTGGLAAVMLDAGPTAVPRATLRVDPDMPLERAADALGAEITERGANLVLWSDTGRVGTHARQLQEATWLAPPVRIYLDLLGDRRGQDAAAHFREVILGT